MAAFGRAVGQTKQPLTLVYVLLSGCERQQLLGIPDLYRNTGNVALWPVFTVPEPIDSGVCNDVERQVTPRSRPVRSRGRDPRGLLVAQENPLVQLL